MEKMKKILGSVAMAGVLVFGKGAGYAAIINTSGSYTTNTGGI